MVLIQFKKKSKKLVMINKHGINIPDKTLTMDCIYINVMYTEKTCFFKRFASACIPLANVLLLKSFNP